jgi:hypothetical protein
LSMLPCGVAFGLMSSSVFLPVARGGSDHDKTRCKSREAPRRRRDGR